MIYWTKIPPINIIIFFLSNRSIKLRTNKTNYKHWKAYIYFFVLCKRYWYVLIKISQFIFSDLRARLAILISENFSLVVFIYLYIYIGTSLTYNHSIHLEQKQRAFYYNKYNKNVLNFIKIKIYLYIKFHLYWNSKLLFKRIANRRCSDSILRTLLLLTFFFLLTFTIEWIAHT